VVSSKIYLDFYVGPWLTLMKCLGPGGIFPGLFLEAWCNVKWLRWLQDVSAMLASSVQVRSIFRRGSLLFFSVYCRTRPLGSGIRVDRHFAYLRQLKRMSMGAATLAVL
jgi:hypothetical protein